MGLGFSLQKLCSGLLTLFPEVQKIQCFFCNCDCISVVNNDKGGKLSSQVSSVVIHFAFIMLFNYGMYSQVLDRYV
jgi:hypothetical protein